MEDFDDTLSHRVQLLNEILNVINLCIAKEHLNFSERDPRKETIFMIIDAIYSYIGVTNKQISEIALVLSENNLHKSRSKLFPDIIHDDRKQKIKDFNHCMKEIKKALKPLQQFKKSTLLFEIKTLLKTLEKTT